MSLWVFDLPSSSCEITQRELEQIEKLLTTSRACARGGSGGACNLAQMGARRAAPGDSGGPVFWGNAAYGLHKGWMYDPSWPFDRDLFSRAERLPDELGVAIGK